MTKLRAVSSCDALSIGIDDVSPERRVPRRTDGRCMQPRHSGDPNGHLGNCTGTPYFTHPNGLVVCRAHWDGCVRCHGDHFYSIAGSRILGPQGVLCPECFEIVRSERRYRVECPICHAPVNTQGPHVVIKHGPENAEAYHSPCYIEAVRLAHERPPVPEWPAEPEQEPGPRRIIL